MAHNYLLFMPSLMRDHPKKIFYTAPDEFGVYEGLQTNIATTDYVIDKLCARGEQIDRILMLCSNEVMEDPIIIDDRDEAVTSFAYYKDTITAKLLEKGFSSEDASSVFFPIALRDINPGDRNGMKAIQQTILNQIDSNSECTLFVDYTGGLRSGSMLLVLFAKMLENQGVIVEDVMYSNISSMGKDSGKGSIESCMDTYRLFDYLDAFAAARNGQLDDLSRVFMEDGETRMYQVIRQTIEARRKGAKGQFRDISDEERAAIAITEDMPIELRIGAQITNKYRRSLTATGIISENANRGNIEKSSQQIREHGLDLLIDKNYLFWKSSFYSTRDQRNNAFFAYAHYYRSFLDFVKVMLEALDLKTDGQTLFQAYSDYVDEKYMLHPAWSEKGSIVGPMEKQFDLRWPEIKEELQDELVSLINRDPQNPDMIIQAVTDYQQIRKRYILGYSNTGKGFPFANVYSGRTYSQLDGTGRKWYDTEYQNRLDYVMKELCAMPISKRVSIVSDESGSIAPLPQLASVFPPIEIQSLFALRKKSWKDFGIQVLLLDSLRSNRNLFTHHGEQTTEEDERRTAQLITDFLSWIESI